MNKHSAGYWPINSYGIIGDMHTVALVNLEGGIDWCCLPIFDSPSLFAQILDKNIGGSFKVSLKDFERTNLSYLHNTNILCNTFEGKSGAIELLDYMPVINPDGTRKDINHAYICRHVECTKGVDVTVEIRLNPRPHYGEEPDQVTYSDHGADINSGDIKLYTTTPISWDGEGNGTITLSHGDSARIVLAYGGVKIPRDLESWTDKQLYDTRHYWENWLSQCLYKGRWRRMVERSALTLKLLAFKPTGAILAAPTTSLPEGIGGVRNWDYRFSWLRDSALILNALLPLGFKEEAADYVDWIAKKCPKDNEPILILYPITDVDTTPEIELPQFEGYCQSSPVRIGNAASDQVQLDVYGEVIDSLYIYGIYGNPITEEQWTYIYTLANRICNEWHEKDEGIWEVRGEQQHFTYSKLMCWVGLDRALRIGEERNQDLDLSRWHDEKEKIRNFIMTECIDPEHNYITQSPENRVADASNLMASLTGFLDPDDEIMHNTLDQTLSQLTRDNLVFRYLNDDGLEGEEGAFNICTFWLVEALSLSGRHEEATTIFNSMLELSSSLGLYAEETDTSDFIALGNFPQAFSHLGLINAAILLNTKHRNKRKKPAWADEAVVVE